MGTVSEPAPADMANTGDLTIGCRADFDAGRWWNGLIDEFRVYKRVLSADEAMAHYNNGRHQP